jgi:hypothetical protein
LFNIESHNNKIISRFTHSSTHPKTTLRTTPTTCWVVCSSLSVQPSTSVPPSSRCSNPWDARSNRPLSSRLLDTSSNLTIFKTQSALTSLKSRWGSPAMYYAHLLVLSRAITRLSIQN